MLQEDISMEFLSPRLFMQTFRGAGGRKPLRKEHLLNKWLLKHGTCISEVNWNPLELKERDM